jgi:hypothetical protein
VGVSEVYFVLAEGVLVESVGESVVVCVPGQYQAIRVDGDTAEAVKAISRQGVVTGDPHGSLAALVDAGVLRVSGTPRTGIVGRRSLLVGGSAGVASAIAALSLPAAAAALSPVVEEPDADDALIGDWRVEGGPLFFRLSRTTYPFLPAVEFDDELEAYNYSRLAFTGQTVPVYPPFGLPQVEWATDPSSFPGLTGEIMGTFTVDNQLYTVIFRPA